MFNYEPLSLGNAKDINVFDPATADSAKSIAQFIEGEVTGVAEVEMSAARPNVANGQVLDDQTYDFPGAVLLSLPTVHGLGELGKIIYPSLQTYATEGVDAFVPAGVKLPSIWLSIEPEIVEDGGPTHFFARVVPATKEHLFRFGNPGNRGAKPNAVQYATTYVHGADPEPLAKGFVSCVPTAAVLTALGWTFVPNAPAP